MSLIQWGKMAKKWIPYALLLPSVVFVLGWIIYPAIVTFYYSLTNTVAGRGGEFIGLTNYDVLVNSAEFVGALKTSAITTFVNVGGSVAVGLGLAMLLHRITKGKEIYIVLLILPLAISPFVAGWTWAYMFHSTFGLFNEWAVGLGLGGAFLGRADTAMWAVTLADFWQWLPFMTFLLVAGLGSIPKGSYSLAEVDGLSRLQRFRYVTFPGIKTVLLIGVLIRFMDAFRVATKTMIMTHGGPGIASQTVSLLAYDQAFTFANLGRAAATCEIQFFITLIVCWILFKKVFPW